MRTITTSACALLCACGQHGYEPSVPDGDAERGRVALAELECGVCHVIPGIPGAYGHVGPPLRAYERNVYVAGKYPNTPETLVAFILDPPSLAAQTAMPAVPMSEGQARDIAAYLYSLP